MVFKRKRRKGQFERATRPRAHGDKRPVIRRRSKAWLLKNAGAADPEAMFELYRRTRDDIWLVKLTDLAFRFGKGKNLTKAVEWYTKAAENGHSPAMHNLGYCFEHGEGVDKNLTKAVEWYTKAAEKGCSDSMHNLGVCFEHGDGVEKNLTKAVEWYTKAAEKGCSDSMHKLAVVRVPGTR